MFVEFEQMPEKSRVWVYQAERFFTEKEEKEVLEQLKAFANQWTAHQNTLMASVCIVRHRFVVISVNQGVAEPSGCSIDTSVAFLRQIENNFGMKLLDRSQIAFLEKESTERPESIQTIDLKDVKQKIIEGVLNSESLVFNNTIADIENFKNKWLEPAKNTWLARYFG
jgi:hypothetical protein